MIGHTLRHNGEVHSIILEGMIEVNHGRERLRTWYIISKICIDVDSYKHHKDIAQDRESKKNLM